MTLLKLDKVAERLDVSKSSIYNWIHDGDNDFPAFKLNGEWRVDEEDLRQYIEKSKTA